MRHARHIFAATLIGALALTGCSTEGAGSIEEPLEAGTPVTITVPQGSDETITWEVVVDDVEEIPVLDDTMAREWTDEDSYPDMACWMITATLTQVDGPESGTPIGIGAYGKVSMHPSLVGIQPNGEQSVAEFETFCDVVTSETANNPEYLRHIDTAPGNGNSVKYFLAPGTKTAERPTVMYIGNDKNGFDEGTASYVTIPE